MTDYFEDERPYDFGEMNPLMDVVQVDQALYGPVDLERQTRQAQIVEVAQAPSPTGVIQIGKFLTTPRGIEAVDGVPSYEDWLYAMKWLRSIDDSKQWMIGDMALIGAEHLLRWLGVEGLDEAQFKTAYEQIIAATGYSYSYVTKLASVSRIYPFFKRLKNTSNLSFSHYLQLIDVASEKDRDTLLTLAERHGWSVRELYKAGHLTKASGKPLSRKQKLQRLDKRLVSFETDVRALVLTLDDHDRAALAEKLHALANSLVDA